MTRDNRFLCFNLGKEEFAIPLLSIREVIGVPETTPIPQMPSYFVGIMNLRGSVISIIDLRLKLGIKPNTTEETSVIILDLGDFFMGIMVDQVNSVAQIEEGAIAEKPQIEQSKISHAIVGVWQKDQKLVLILDVPRVLSLEDRTIAGKASAA